MGALNIALAIYRLEPAGGLERHALRLAALLTGRGHAVTLYATGEMASAPPGVGAVRLTAPGGSNHGRMASFGEALAKAASGADLVVGFQKLPGLDVLFCADPCVAARALPPGAALLPRYRTLKRLEAACFGGGSKTRVLMLAPPQLSAYEQVYGTLGQRARVLAPTAEPARRGRTPSTEDRRAARRRLGLEPDDLVWLWVGLQPMVKGLDRVLDALKAWPRARLLACGADPDNAVARRLMAEASRDGRAGRARLEGLLGADDLALRFAAADLLVHPARADVTGMVILEALACGLPVIATAECGFAGHITDADAGRVLASPFDPADLEDALKAADAQTRAIWAGNAARYGADPALYQGLEQAADLIESTDWAAC